MEHMQQQSAAKWVAITSTLKYTSATSRLSHHTCGMVVTGSRIPCHRNQIAIMSRIVACGLADQSLADVEIPFFLPVSLFRDNVHEQELQEPNSSMHKPENWLKCSCIFLGVAQDSAPCLPGSRDKWPRKMSDELGDLDHGPSWHCGASVIVNRYYEGLC